MISKEDKGVTELLRQKIYAHLEREVDEEEERQKRIEAQEQYAEEIRDGLLRKADYSAWKKKHEANKEKKELEEMVAKQQETLDALYEIIAVLQIKADNEDDKE